MPDSADTLSPAEISAANPGGIPQAVDMPGGNIVNMLDDDHKRGAYMKGAEELEKRKIGAEGALAAQESRRSEQYRTRMEGMISREAASAEELHPWNADAELGSRKTGLWDQFGSPGFIVAMLGSAFTATPMNSALNAGAAAMNAINQGDMKSYEKAFEAWKDNSKLVLDRIKLEHEQFADIDKLRQTDLAEWRVKAELLAQNYGDQRKLLLLKNGMDEDYFKARDAEVTAARNLATAQQGIMEQHALMMAVQNDPRYKSGDPQKMYEAVLDAEKKLQEAKYSGRYSSFSPGALKTNELNAVKDDVRKEHPDWSEGKVAIEAEKRFSQATAKGSQKERDINDVKTDVRKEHPDWDEGKVTLEARHRMKEAETALTANKRYELQSHLALYDDAVKIIDQVTDTLDRYVGAAGLPGRATRLTERVRNLAGATQTDRVQMMRDIEQLQLMAPQLLLDRTTGRPLSAEHEYIESVVAGLSAGDTTANTLRAMKEVRDRLITIRDRDKARLGGSEAPAAAPAKNEQPGWESFPTVH